MKDEGRSEGRTAFTSSFRLHPLSIRSRRHSVSGGGCGAISGIGFGAFAGAISGMGFDGAISGIGFAGAISGMGL
jgi:hypothetical protein